MKILLVKSQYYTENILGEISLALQEFKGVFEGVFILDVLSCRCLSW